jgi:hypothetical protein
MSATFIFSINGLPIIADESANNKTTALAADKKILRRYSEFNLSPTDPLIFIAKSKIKI